MSADKEMSLEDAQKIVATFDNPSVWRAAKDRSSEERLAIGIVIMDYRLRGKTFESIEKELGIPAATATRYRDKAMEAFPAPVVASARAEEVRRLDVLAEAVWTKAQAGDEKAIASFMKISERKAKLLGWDSPIQVEQQVTEITAEERAMQALIAEAERDQAIEHNQQAVAQDFQ